MMNRIDEILEELMTLEDADFGVSVSEEEIQLFEERLRIRLPQSYRKFLQRFGALTIGDKEVIGGITGEPYDILSLTEKHSGQHQMPSSLLILQNDDETPYCFDLNSGNSNGEYEVICYQPGKGYKKTAKDFSRWVEEFVLYVYGEDVNADF